MTDRVPGAPGRCKAVVTGEELEKLQTGKEFAITLRRDDQPIKPGTPYSKAAVLPDNVAKELCPEINDPTPGQAFEELNKRTKENASRIDTFVALPEGSTTGDAELADIRVGYTGETYPSAGEAVRQQIGKLETATSTRFEAVEEKIDKLTSSSDSIICEATGNPIVLKDSSNRELQGLTLFNKNLFDESTLLNATKWTVENDIYTGNNSYLRKYWMSQQPVTFAPNTQYYICFYGSSAVSGLSNRVIVRYTDGTMSEVTFNDLELTFKELVTTSGKSVNEIVMDYGNSGIISLSKFMICVASNNNAYAPYFSGGDVEIKVMGNNKEQTLTVSVPNGFGTDGFVCEDFAQLHTYKPNTTIINDVGAEMKVEYVADTKAYIDNKFNELAATLTALTGV